MSRFAEAVAELVRSRRMYIVDKATGTWDDYTAEEYIVVSPLFDDERFQPFFSLKDALELCHRIVTERAEKN